MMVNTWHLASLGTLGEQKWLEVREFKNSGKKWPKKGNLFSKSMIFFKSKFMVQKILPFFNWGRGQGHGSKVRIWSNKKIFRYNFFTLRKSAFMTMVNFYLEVAWNWRSSFLMSCLEWVLPFLLHRNFLNTIFNLKDTNDFWFKIWEMGYFF